MYMPHSPSTDLRVSFPLSLFCLATMTWNLWLAFADSLTPPTPHDNPSPTAAEDHIVKPKPTVVMPPKTSATPHGPKDSLVSDGLEHDIYWDDELA